MDDWKDWLEVPWNGTMKNMKKVTITATQNIGMGHIVPFLHIPGHVLVQQIFRCRRIEAIEIQALLFIIQQCIDRRPNRLRPLSAHLHLRMHGKGGIDFFRSFQGTVIEGAQAGLPQSLWRVMHADLVNIDPIHEHKIRRCFQQTVVA